MEMSVCRRYDAMDAGAGGRSEKRPRVQRDCHTDMKEIGECCWSERIVVSLRRITTSGNYIPEIDGLRFIAILSVICFHVPVQLPVRGAHMDLFWYLIGNGKRGVQLFFVISGFILGLPFASHLLKESKAVRLRSYYLRRLTRLEPPYILAILIRIPLLILVMHRPWRFILAHGAASLLYLHSLIFGQMSAVNPPAWSLEVEIQFYCLAPVLALMYFRIKPHWLRWILGLIFVVSAGALQLHWIGYTESTRLSLSILNYGQYFFTGFILCDLYLTAWDSIPPHWLWDIASVGLWYWIFAGRPEASHILLPVAALLAYVGAFKGVLFRWFFRNNFVALVGGMCYSIYLTHNLAITAVGVVLRHWLNAPHVGMVEKAVVSYALSVPLALAVGLFFYLLIERPCMDKNWPTKLKRWLQSKFAKSVPVGG